jgi:hypothetical protein
MDKNYTVAVNRIGNPTYIQAQAAVPGARFMLFRQQLHCWRAARFAKQIELPPYLEGTAA